MLLAEIGWVFIPVGVIVGAGVGIVIMLAVAAAKRKKMDGEVGQLMDQAKQEAERIKKDAFLQCREETYKIKEANERERSERMGEMKQLERRLLKREDALDLKGEKLQKTEKDLARQEAELHLKQKGIADKEAELASMLAKERETLQAISGLNKEEATKLLLSKLDTELQQEKAHLINKVMNEVKETQDTEARSVVALAIQRCAADHTAESVVSTVDLPNEDMKGRIIGREGRNIRAFERATGIDLIVDDTPGVVVVSGFDAVRREMARRAMEKLVLDGRIHPARIEEIVEITKKEMEDQIAQTGKQVCFDLDMHGLHPKLVMLLGRLKYRTSYGQNVLQHSMEVAQLASLMAQELKLDAALAKRCGLLHDIGKAVDQEMEGTHPNIGAELAKRFDEKKEVIDSAGNHHGTMDALYPYTVITAAADAISASRPGARRETLEKYIKRLERLESIATSHPGVDNAFAIQAGREVRVLVNAGKVDDKAAAILARDVAKEIEKELNYPGEIKVTVIRETRIVEYAR
jgi:ribonuclease Y